jgi:hypothetical protein
VGEPENGQRAAQPIQRPVAVSGPARDTFTTDREVADIYMVKAGAMRLFDAKLLMPITNRSSWNIEMRTLLWNDLDDLRAAKQTYNWSGGVTRRFT